MCSISHITDSWKNFCHAAARFQNPVPQLSRMFAAVVAVAVAVVVVVAAAVVAGRVRVVVVRCVCMFDAPP